MNGVMTWHRDMVPMTKECRPTAGRGTRAARVAAAGASNDGVASVAATETMLSKQEWRGTTWRALARCSNRPKVSRTRGEDAKMAGNRRGKCVMEGGKKVEDCRPDSNTEEDEITQRVQQDHAMDSRGATGRGDYDKAVKDKEQLS
ncbi:hypothetical protein B0H14DRAFT_2570341 [Mycena olivaceomarginata]|nr:hypothetical protein B0H14DRAFT_2570341 [Mycena olivaceomarginata]